NNCKGVITVSCTTSDSTNSVFPYYNIPNSGVLQGQFVTVQSGNNYINYWNVSSTASGTYQVGCYLDNTLSYTDLNKNVNSYPYSQPFLKDVTINGCASPTNVNSITIISPTENQILNSGSSFSWSVSTASQFLYAFKVQKLESGGYVDYTIFSIPPSDSLIVQNGNSYSISINDLINEAEKYHTGKAFVDGNYKIVLEAIDQTQSATGSSSAVSFSYSSGALSSESHKIGVRDGSSGSVQLASASSGEAEFYDIVNGQEFIPRGNVYFLTMPQGFKAEQPRYSGWAYDSLDIYSDVFSSQVYNHNKISGDLDKMKSLGYNVVKIYLPYYDHPNVASGNRLNDAVLDNMVDFLRMARDKEMYVYFNSGQIPLSYNDIVDSYPAPANIDGFNGFFMNKGMIEAEKQYHLDLLDGINQRDSSVMNTIFGYDLAVEGFYTSYENGKPWSLTSGTVTPADGKTYDLSIPADRKALADESTAYWVQQVAGAVKEKYPNLLLTESIFTPYLSNPSACIGYDGLVNGCGKEPLNVKVIASSPYIDFLTLHIYPLNLDSYSAGSYDIKQDMASAGIIEGQKFTDGTPIGKPLFVGEFGSHADFYLTLNSAKNAIVQQQVNSCDYGFKGWIYFPWYGLNPSDSTSHQGVGVWTATEENYAIANIMSPNERSDACASPNFLQKVVNNVVNSVKDIVNSVKGIFGK
ncbi:MAG: hypothetical protein Q7S56_03695, partial [Nanoarchaeota archaeon]|nr:hypothetical protein [Nanoarchaeota archaeon]